MDKKSKFTTPSSNKGAAGESKKNQDVNGKVFPKTSRRREPPSANACSKNEQPRKSSVPKARTFDKRPKPKGQYYGSTKENSKVDEQEMAELGSVMVPGSKKQNLNHLLNFHYEPREVQGSSGGWSYGRSSKNYNNSNRWLPPVQRHKYNKELFLQANCQFVVNINGDYSIYLADPDILVDWNLIEQIKVHTSESLSCPICLGFPVAGRMTRCGHVYCWPCILHYLSLSDKSWRKCPICFESVHKSDLKSVIEITQTPINIGDNIKMRLMRRQRGSLLAIPVPELNTITKTDPETFFRITDEPPSQIYSKLLLANAKDILEIIDLEKTHLNFELMEDSQSPESCFIEQALEELSLREINILKQTNNADKTMLSSNQKVNKKNNFTTTENLEMAKIGNNERENNDIEPMEAIEKCTSPQSLPKYFYFYQAEDGQHVYLHAMNIKMLELQYGNLDNCPRIINGKLIEKESGSFTEDLRKRLRCLSHLPLTCGFDIAEIELDMPLISEEVKELFREQVEGREKRRKRRDRDEKQREKKINAEENKRMGKFPTPKVHIESIRHFPQWQPEPQSSSMTIPTPPESLAASSLASSPARSSFDDESASFVDDNTWTLSQNDPGPSFAQMLRNKGSRMPSSSTWPSIPHFNNSNKPENGAWGQKPPTASNEDDYESAPPAYSQNFGDVLAQALEQSELLDTTVGHDEVGMKKSKKKKRGKATVLFATGMTRSS